MVEVTFTTQFPLPRLTRFFPLHCEMFMMLTMIFPPPRLWENSQARLLRRFGWTIYLARPGGLYNLLLVKVTR